MFGRREDPFQPGAYVDDGKCLYEIVDRVKDVLTLENCRTDWRHERSVTELLGITVGIRSSWRLTRPAPQPPDFVGE